MKFFEKNIFKPAKKSKEAEKAPVDFKENSEDPLEEGIKKELDPIIEVLCPDGEDLKEYEQKIINDLFESVKKQQVARGVLLEDPTNTIKEAKDVLNTRIKTVLEDAQDYEKREKLDPGLIKKAKLAMIFQGDLTPWKKYAGDVENEWHDISSLRDYIVGGDKDHKFTEADIDILMRTKYKKSLTDSDLSKYIGSYGTCESIPKSLMIGLAQSEASSRYYPIEYALEAAEKGKYDDECLEKLLANGSSYSKKALEHSDKFEGDVIEKILQSGHLDFSSVIIYLKSLNLPKEKLEKYINIFVKNNTNNPRNDNYDNEETYNKYRNTIDKVKQLKKLKDQSGSDKESLETVKDIIARGEASFVVSSYAGQQYLDIYVSEDYENFVKDVQKNKQEGLLIQYFKEEDKMTYVKQLITEGKEYQVVKLRSFLDDHSLGLDIFNKLKEKKFTDSFKGDLSKFKDLPPEEALEFIRNGRADIFLEHIKSFKFPESFLKDPIVQEACLKEFNNEILSYHPNTAGVIYQKIPFPKETTDKLIMNTINKKWRENDRIDHACEVVQVFPHIKEFLNNPETQDKALEGLKKAFSYYPSSGLAILKSFPMPEKYLKSDDLEKICIDSIKRDGLRSGLNGGLFQDTEKHFSTIKEISQYVKLPEYLSEQENVIDSIKNSSEEATKSVAKEYVLKILNSETPNETNKKILELLEEMRVAGINGNRDLTLLYINEFETGGAPEEKTEFIKCAIVIDKKLLGDVKFMQENWQYLYENLQKLPDDEFEKRKNILQKISANLKSTFLDDMAFQKIFDQILSYTPEQQAEFFEILETDKLNLNEVREEDWAKAVITYINDTEDVRWLRNDDERKAKITKLFNGSYKDIVLDNMQKEWGEFLRNEQNILPPNTFMITKIIDKAGGAGNLKHVESLGNLVHQTNTSFQKPKTVDRTKNEITRLLLNQEKRFDKEKWSQDDRSEFYNLSADIIEAAPSLYSSFSPVFETMTPKDMKAFMKEVFPYYQADLVIMQEINDEDTSYKPKDLASMRQSIKEISKKMKQNPESKTEIFNTEKLRLLEIVKKGFKERFGLIKVPEKFEKEDLRSIQNGIRYIGNISGRSVERETVIAFYLGLQLSRQWDKFRQGQKINAEEYFSGKQLEIIKPLLEEKLKSDGVLAETAGISKEQVPKFQEILQREVETSNMGDIQTVDVKLGNIKRNIEELSDPDIYPNPKDRELMSLLTKYGKSIGAVLAKTYGEVSGKKVEMTEGEKDLQSKLANIFGVDNWSTAKVKQIQDAVQPFGLIVNMINKMDEEKVDQNIEELQKKLMPSGKIIEIFKRLGEEFKQESGALALSKDLETLEGLVVKNSDKIKPEEREAAKEHLDSINLKMNELEGTLTKVREYFEKIKKSSHIENHELLKNRLADIEKVMYSTDSKALIVSKMTKDLNLIIESMRQCLGCMRKEVNNDTNLAFGDYNKFFMINQSGKESGSISDEIVFFVPVKTPDGNQEMSFVMDKVYGSKSSDILISNITSVFKKMQALKKETPDARVSISISSEAMSSVGLNTELLKKKLGELEQNIKYSEFNEKLVANMPKSAFSDNYIEFGSSDSRKSGEREFSGLVLR